MARITNKTISEIEGEYAKWSEFLNGGIGLFAFNLGISCLGTSRPDITAFLSLLFLLVFSAYGQRHFPQKLKSLRKTELSGVDEIALLGIEKKYFGFAALFRNFPVYLVGWCFLFGVAIYGALKSAGKL
jgi:hypothetical protein